MIAQIKKWLAETSAEKPIKLMFYVFIIATAIVIPLSLPFYLDDFIDFLGNVLVEVHGMLIGLVFGGMLLFWLNRLGERKTTIRRYRREIEDYLGWRDEEAMYKIVANIKRLNQEGVTDIKLIEAFLKGAKLRGTDLRGADLRGSDLRRANLIEIDLRKADLRKADLRGSDLRGANLKEADLRGANLRGAMYNKDTVWPENFDPEKEGATYNEDTVWPSF
jgi:hypothetical protein